MADPEEGRATNPVFGGRKLKLGTFRRNMNNVDGLKTMSETMGLDGVPLSWLLCEDGVRAFQRETYRWLVRAGLR